MKSRCQALLPIAFCLLGGCRSMGSAEQAVAPVVVAIPSQAEPEPKAATNGASRKEALRFVGLTATNQGDGYCAWRSDGTLWCWGRSARTRWSLGFKDDDQIALTTSDGPWHIHCSFTVQQVKGPTGVKAAALGQGHGCAVDGTGDLWCWGLTDNEKEAQPVRLPLHEIVSVTAALGHTCVQDLSGNVYCWGETLPLGLMKARPKSPTIVTHLKGARQIIALQETIAVLDDTGHVSIATNSEQKSLLSHQFTQIWARWNEVFGTTETGTMWFWRGTPGTSPIRYPEFDTAANISISDRGACALIPENQIRCAFPIFQENNRLPAHIVAGLERVTSLHLADFTDGLGTQAEGNPGVGTGCALTRDGEIWCFGTYPMGCDAARCVDRDCQRLPHKIEPGAQVLGPEAESQ